MSIALVLVSVCVLGASLLFMFFGEAVDTRSEAQKAADASALAAAEAARGPWITSWLGGQSLTITIPDPPPPPPPPVSPPPLGTGDEDDPVEEEPEPEPEPEPEYTYSYAGPDSFWSAAGWSGYGSAVQFALKNDSASVTGYRVQSGRQIGVDVRTSPNQVDSPQGRRIQQTLVAPADATSQIMTPAGLSCAPVGSPSSGHWTLRCSSAKGSALAYYYGTTYLSHQRTEFERMFTIRLVS